MISLHEVPPPQHPTTVCGCFIVVCSFCHAEISRDIRTDFEANLVSHGMCTPLCEPAIKMGWGKFMKGGDQ